jgi:hypothetical protein
MKSKPVIVPVLNRAAPAGDIYGDTEGEGPAARFFQDGHYFSGDGTYLRSEKNVRKVVEPVAVEKNVQVLSAVTEDAEVEELLKDPAADDLLAMDRDTLVEMVKQANGPVLAGEKSSRMMAAWLIKYTMAPAAPAPATEAQGLLIAPDSDAADGQEAPAGSPEA